MGEDGQFSVVRELGPGCHFGEVALIRNVKRTLSVKAVGNSQLLCLTRATFSRILGSIKRYLKEDYVNVESVDGTFEDPETRSLKSRNDT